MAFLDNSGDIILDAVLTDTGRMRLAKGDGSFRIAKFALGDDEIDYSLYNKSNASGSAYYDLEILQTPVLEAFSNNAASMKSMLISIARNNLLYLPVIKINTTNTPVNQATSLVSNGYVLAVDKETEDALTNASYNNDNVSSNGFLYGESTSDGYIRVDQGLDTVAVAKAQGLDQDLTEGQFLVQIDNRIASIVSKDREPELVPYSYIDDDYIASYYYSFGVNTKFVSEVIINTSNNSDGTSLAGPAGNSLEFKLKSSLEVTDSNYLFDTLGKTLTFVNAATGTYKGILSNIRITGLTTGNFIDIPLMVVKRTQV